MREPCANHARTMCEPCANHVRTMCEPRANNMRTTCEPCCPAFLGGVTLFLVMSARIGAVSATCGQNFIGSGCVRCKFGVFVRDFDMEPEMALNPEKRRQF